MTITDYRLARQAQVERAHAEGAEEGTPEWREFFGQGEHEGRVGAERPVQLRDWMVGDATPRYDTYSVPADSLIGDHWAEMMAVSDPAARSIVATNMLGELAELEKVVSQMRREAVKDLYATEQSWAKVADILGVSRARAHKLAQTG